MITGLHLLLYSKDPAADRAFLRDALGWPSVEDADSEPGWLIFKTPATELGVHPTDAAPSTELHLMCDDLDATIADLTAKGASTTPPNTRPYGRLTTLTLPSGTELGLYQPTHQTAINL